MSITAMKQAMAYIKKTAVFIPHEYDSEGIAVVTALRTAIQEAESVRPVAYLEPITGQVRLPTDEHRVRFPKMYQPLYFATCKPSLQVHTGDIEGLREALAIALYEAVNDDVETRTPWTYLHPSAWDKWRRAANLAAAPAAQPAKSLTRSEKNRLWSECAEAKTLSARASLFGSKIEAAHGIKEQP